MGFSFVLADLEARPPLSSTVLFSSCIIAWDGEFEPLCTGGDEAMIFRSSPGIEASWRKESLNPGLWSHNLSPGALVQTQVCYANSPGSVWLATLFSNFPTGSTNIP